LYVLILRVDSPASVRIGALGRVDLRPGYYAYCGSARRSLSSRISRHVARRKKLRWHIDYLTCRRNISVESARIFPGDVMTECELNSVVREFPGALPIPGFGCSDCKCVSHLTFLGDVAPDTFPDPNVPHGRP
jgi:Uri superfamily endonuclease